MMIVAGSQIRCLSCNGTHFQVGRVIIEGRDMIATKCDNCGVAALLVSSDEDRDAAVASGLNEGTAPARN